MSDVNLLVSLSTKKVTHEIQKRDKVKKKKNFSEKGVKKKKKKRRPHVLLGRHFLCSLLNLLPGVLNAAPDEATPFILSSKYRSLFLPFFFLECFSVVCSNSADGGAQAKRGA